MVKFPTDAALIMTFTRSHEGSDICIIRIRQILGVCIVVFMVSLISLVLRSTAHAVGMNRYANYASSNGVYSLRYDWQYENTSLGGFRTSESSTTVHTLVLRGLITHKAASSRARLMTATNLMQCSEV